MVEEALDAREVAAVTIIADKLDKLVVCRSPQDKWRRFVSRGRCGIVRYALQRIRSSGEHKLLAC